MLHLLLGLRHIGVALETVDAYAGIGMAGGAKMLCVRGSRITSIRPWIDVTVDALLETVPLSAYATVHGLVALMKYELHVIAAHDLGRFHTLLRLGLGNLRNIRIRNISLRDEGLAVKRQPHHGQKDQL